LATDADGWELRITDDGVGFDPSATGRVGHHGMTNIRERAAARLGGTVEIDSAPGAGTSVIARVPSAALQEASRT
jgi:signal transduction histidine kinase